MNNPKPSTLEERVPQSVRAANSHFNLEANAIVSDMEALVQRIRGLLDQQHGGKCRCDFCAAKRVTSVDCILEDLRGTLWAVDVAKGCLDGMLLMTDQKREEINREIIAESKAKQAVAKK
jgi:hypothetical protein